MTVPLRQRLTAALLMLVCSNWPDDLQASPLCSPLTDPPTSEGVLTGRLLTPTGAPSRQASAFVFLVDNDSGWPIDADSGRPVSRATGFRGIDGWRHARTEHDGRFRFEHLRPGTYRLVAQSWPGLTQVPSMKANDGPVMLHGAADNIRVQSGQTTTANIRALGSAGNNVRSTGRQCFRVRRSEAQSGGPHPRAHSVVH